MKLRTNQSGIAHLAAIIIVVLIAGLGFAGWRVYSVQKENDRLKSNTSHPEVKVDDKKEEPKIPEGYAEHTDQNLKISFQYPKEWRIADKCPDSTSIAFLINKQSLKCGTEDMSDGPVFYKDQQGRVSCSGAQQDPFASTECQSYTIAGKDVSLTTSTYVKDGAFGELKGSKHYQYDFSESNLRVSYFASADAKNQKEAVDKLLTTLKFL